MTTVLGAPVAAVGLIVGVAESTASLLKLGSGWWCDRLRQRLPLVVAGYGFAVLGKLVLGIIGLGGAFGIMLPSLVSHPLMKILAGADLRQEARERFASDFSGEGLIVDTVVRDSAATTTKSR